MVFTYLSQLLFYNLFYLIEVLEQDPMAYSAFGFDLGISKDFGIMTHRRESLWVDDIGRRKGFSQRLIPSNIRRPTRLMREPNGAHLCQETRKNTKFTIPNSTNTYLRENVFGAWLSQVRRGQRGLIHLSLVHAPAQVEHVSEVQITVRNEDKRLSIRGCPRRRPMACLHVCMGLTTI